MTTNSKEFDSFYKHLWLIILVASVSLIAIDFFYLRRDVPHPIYYGSFIVFTMLLLNHITKHYVKGRKQLVVAKGISVLWILLSGIYIFFLN